MLLSPESPSLFSRNRLVLVALLVLLFAAALGIRVYDLKDPPFDFHPARQFFTAIMARGEYYQGLTSAPESLRRLAITYWKAQELDLPTVDLLAAWTYRLVGHEDIFYPRLYSILFWLAGGAALYLLVRDLVSTDGALLSLGFYLFVPYGVFASRSFQPDQLMLCLILFAWWAMFRWKQAGTWKWALLAGLFSAAAMTVKVLAAFSILGGMAGVLFSSNIQSGSRTGFWNGLRKTLRDLKFWVVGLLAALPVIVWLVHGFFGGGSLGGKLGMRFYPNLWIDPVFYLRLEAMAQGVVGLLPLILALVGLFLFIGHEKRIFVACLWGSYIAFAFAFSYFFMTHDYYHLTLVPITAISLAPLGEVLLRKLESLNPGWLARTALAGIVVLGLGANLWNIRQTLHKADYRAEAAMLTQVGQLVGPDISTVAMTQDYGYPLFYYGWIFATNWPYTGDAALRQLAGVPTPAFSDQFDTLTAGKQYFIITDLVELDRQSTLKEYLATHYPVFQQGEGFIIYDLLHPRKSP